jgi:hypothetical protein
MRRACSAEESIAMLDTGRADRSSALWMMVSNCRTIASMGKSAVNTSAA